MLKLLQLFASIWNQWIEQKADVLRTKVMRERP